MPRYPSVRDHLPVGRGRPDTAPRARDLAILNAIAAALNGAADVQQALDRTLALVTDLVGLRSGWVWLRDAESGQFYRSAEHHLPPYLQEPVRMAGTRCWCIEAFENGELSPTNIDVMECSRLRPAVLARQEALTLGLASHASVPLAFRGQRLGIMNLTGPAWRRLTRDELRLLSTIAYQVGVAIERARLAEESTRLARAEERARLAREIHDTLAQDLTAISLDLEGALHHLDTQPERSRERLARALATARRSLEEARRSVGDLRAAPLAGRPLAEALAALGRAFSAETGIRVQVHAAGQRALPLRVEGEVYRIAQEALANVRKHAHARSVDLFLRIEPTRLALLIRDDGRGFPAPAAGGGYGLEGMRERARLLGGSLRVASRPGRGTTVAVRAPLPAATAAAP